MNEFTHLSLHSEYSISDSVIFLDRLPAAVVEHGMNSVALTDTNLFAMVKFQEKCHKAGVKPIFGCDLKIIGFNDLQDSPSRILLFAMNDEGYRNLLKLVTRANTNSQYYGCLTLEHLETLNSGVLVLSGGISGTLGKALSRNDLVESVQIADWFKQHFEDRFYVEVARTGRANEGAYIRAAVKFADEQDLPLVATNDAIMLEESDFLLHDARMSTQRNERMEGEYSWKGHYTDQQFLRSPAQMAEVFQDIPDAIQNANEIARRCNVEIPTGTLFQKPFPTDDISKNATILQEKASQALEELLTEGLADESDPELTQQMYRERLQHELEVIIDMKYEGYFLIVQDMVQWAKQNHILVGHGRGSGAASLVSMVLGITAIDPLRHKLLFERLLNPGRRTMPDLDIDFSGDRRDEVERYVEQKYGSDVVGRIVAHQTKGARGAIQAIGRSMEVAQSDVSRISNLIPTRPPGITIQQACEDEPRLIPTVRNLGLEPLMDEARKLEGIVSNLSHHPAGVVIAPSSLDNFVACHSEGGRLISQLDKDDVEKAGLVKFDLLSLKNLTAIQKSLDAINERRKESEPEFDIDKVPLDDTATYELLSTGEAQAVFQLGSAQIQNLLRNVQPQEFRDIVAVIALYRPGPLNAGFHERYYLRKQGAEEVQYDLPELQDILEDNHGVMIYQEDVMTVAKVLAGFSLEEADIMREAMGKKQIEKLAGVKERFINGCIERGIDSSIAQKIYSQMEGFAEYAFPRGHATAYAMLSYQTAYLKAHYPAEFMAANISVFTDDREQLVRLIKDVMRMNFEVLPPDVNAATKDCQVTDEGIRIALPCIKGCGYKDVDVIKEASREGEFVSFFDFCNRVISNDLHASKIGYMIDAGVFDQFETDYPTIGEKRAVLHAKLTRISEVLSPGSDSSGGLFGGPREEMVLADFKVPAAFSQSEVEERERSVVGLLISDRERPRNFREFQAIRTHTLGQANQLRTGKATLIGTIEETSVSTTSKGEEFIMFTLQDDTGKMQAILWPEAFRNYSSLILPGEFVILDGQIGTNRNNNNSQMVVSKVYDLTSARRNWQAQFSLRFANETSRQMLTQENLLSLKTIVGEQDTRSGSELEVCVVKDGAELAISLGDGFKRVAVTSETQSKLRSLFGDEVVQVRFNK